MYLIIHLYSDCNLFADTLNPVFVIESRTMFSGPIKSATDVVSL
uniref:Uncharacterized protein n=1 Tax=Siphoviridae sp. ctPsO101 TaxID=2825487 RepID=A0A8S5PWQ9_9CAUD|nr:MAG TPA: hypothetical protein [Siphoviridae sp. ctPsO101]